MKRILLAVLTLALLVSSAEAQTKFRLRQAPTASEFGYSYYCQGGYAGSGTVRMTDGSETDVQAKHDAASNGDIICVPTGNHTWNGAGSGISVTKELLFVGAGIGNTVITRDDQYIFYFTLSASFSGNTRITGFTFQGSTTQSVFYFTSAAYDGIPTGRWRVDHNHFNYGSGSRIGVWSVGLNYGLVDHNTFTWNTGDAIEINAYLASESQTIGDLHGDLVNDQAAEYSSDKFVFVENNTFTPGSTNELSVADMDIGGGRIVYRYNTCTQCYIYNHWTRTGDMGGQLWQIYNNTFTGNANYGSGGHPMRLEAGTGVIYNNTITGYGNYYAWLDDRRAARTENTAPLNDCDGTETHDGNAGDASAPGWPCFGQIGRAPGVTSTESVAGTKQSSDPVYLWNNGTGAGCSSGGSCTDALTVFADPAAYIKATGHTTGGFGNGDVDYVLNGSTAKPGYTAPTYPHAKVGQPWP